MSYFPDFAEQLNQLLIDADRSPAWLARRLDVNPSTVNRWLNHGSRPGDPDTVARVADLLGASERRQELLVAAGYGYLEATHDSATTVSAESAEETNAPVPSSNLPVQAMPLVGRVDELNSAARMAWRSGCALGDGVGTGRHRQNASFGGGSRGTTCRRKVCRRRLLRSTGCHHHATGYDHGHRRYTGVFFRWQRSGEYDSEPAAIQKRTDRAGQFRAASAGSRLCGRYSGDCAECQAAGDHTRAAQPERRMDARSSRVGLPTCGCTGGVRRTTTR